MRHSSSSEPAAASTPSTSPDENDEAAAAASNGNAGEWPEPFDIFSEDRSSDMSAPTDGSLPQTIQRWVKTESRRKGVSEAFAAVAAVTAVAGAIGNGLRIRVRLNDTGWTEPCCLWVCLVANPGSGKSPIISAALDPLRSLDKDRARIGKFEIDKFNAENKGKPKSKITQPPIIPCSIVDDVTMEKMGRLLSENPRGLVLAPDELVQTISSFGAYKSNGGGDRTQLLKMFDGGVITIDRVGAGRIRAPGALVTFLSGTQPDKMRPMTKDLGGDGFMQRQLCIMDDEVDRGGGIDEAPDERALTEYFSLVKCLATAKYDSKTIVQLSTESHGVLKETQDHIRKLGNLSGASTAWKGHVEKWGKILPRIALAFHAIESWELLGAVDPSHKVDVSTARKVAAFCEFLVARSLAFYEKYFDPEPIASEARAIAGYLLTKPELNNVTQRTIYDARKHLRNDRQFLKRAMTELENVGWVLPVDPKGDARSGWVVNPGIHSRYKKRATWEITERARKQKAIVAAGKTREERFSGDKLSKETSK